MKRSTRLWLGACLIVLLSVIFLQGSGLADILGALHGWLATFVGETSVPQSKLDPDYWPTLAQVLPVIGLGVVVEARAVTRAWTDGTPTWLRRFQWSIWSLILIGCAAGEIVAFRSLTGESTDAIWPYICNSVVTWGVAVLVVSPALELFMRAFAEPVAALFSAHPKDRISMWRSRTRLERLFKRMQNLEKSSSEVIAIRDQQYETLDALTERIRKVIVKEEFELVRGAESPMSPELISQHHEKIDTAREIFRDIEKAAADREDWSKDKERILANVEDTRRYLESIGQTLSELDEKARKLRLESRTAIVDLLGKDRHDPLS